MSASHTNPDSEHMGMLQDISRPPIFVMGDHRSGTTILYKVLEATGCFNIVTAYHIIKYNEIIYNYVNDSVDHSKQQLAALFIQKGLNDRVIDRLQAHPDTPEEYGFILRNANYRLWLKPDNVADLVELCKKIQLTSDPVKPILLKNPWDYYLNFMYVKEKFPDSKFVFINRNPVDIINSQLKSIRSMLDSRNEYVALFSEWYGRVYDQPIRRRVARLLFSSHVQMGFRLVYKHVTLATNYFVQNISSLPENDYVCVRYEDLCAEPRQTIRKILDVLDVQEAAHVDYESLIQTREGPLLSEVAANKQRIYERMKPYYDYCGYSVNS